MTQKLWGGRFKKPFDEDAKVLSYSLSVDCRLAPYDIAVNRAHVKGLHKTGYLSEDEATRLDTALAEVGEALSKPNHTLFENDEDIHSCIERLVTAKLGDLGKKMHTGKSRNDQVITDVRLYVKAETTAVIDLLKTLRKTLLSIAEQHKTTIFPGFTHFQMAQPVLLAHHILVYIAQFGRDIERFSENLKRTDLCPLGSGALAGNNYAIDREFVAKTLGFSGITRNSMDAVSDRDFMMEFLSNASLCMTHLSRFCEELVLWSSPLIGFVTIGDEFTTGSSLMPQKKNPDIAELIRGKSGRVLSHVVGLTHIIKALPLTYNRDLQEDKEMLFDSVDTLKISLLCFEKMMHTLVFNEGPIQAALSKGYLLATDFADYLVSKGVPFRESHDITGAVVSYAVEQQKGIEELTLAELQSFYPGIENDVQDVFKLENAINQKNLVGGTAQTQVEAELTRLKKELHA
jgi:argininosuccinate lyase